MALTALFRGLEVDLAARRATLRCGFASRDDLPNKYDKISSITLLDTTALAGANWYVDNVRVLPSVVNECVIEARQPGLGWTGYNSTDGILAPIATRGNYKLLPPDSKPSGGVIKLGHWSRFSNWSDTDNWETSGYDPVKELLRTWEVEFLATSSYHTWQGKKNGTWPTGMSPPAGTGAGVYWCRAIEVLEEKEISWAGTITTYYRHFATFWEAPSAPTPGQLTWVFTSW